MSPRAASTSLKEMRAILFVALSCFYSCRSTCAYSFNVSFHSDARRTLFSTGTISCPTSESHLVLRDKKEERSWEEGGSAISPEGVRIKRRRCRLKFPESACEKFNDEVQLPPAEAILQASKPKPIVFIVKLGVGSPWAGDRAKIITKLVLDVAQHGGVQLVLLCDRTQWTKQGYYGDASSAFPSVLSPLVWQYSIADISRIFPTKTLPLRAEAPQKARARAIGKYYETYSWGWWWHQRKNKKEGSIEEVDVKRIWVAEDDTVFSGNWAELLTLLESGLHDIENSGDRADLIAFREFCTPEKSWVWARWMHEGWSNLTTPGQGLETWMTLSGFSPRFLDAALEQQRNGVCGHVEWFPPTFALRNGLGLVFVEHDLRGKKLGHGCPGTSGARHASPRGGTFNYCCQGANTVDAENWFEGWRQSGACAPPTILHPVKGDACGRFSASGFGRGCWKRVNNPAFKDHSKDEKSKVYWQDIHVQQPPADAKSAKAFHAYSESELKRTLN